ncbi:MAG: ABC transporter permease [Eubacteriales bacterium]
MRAFIAFTKKEFTENLRTYKLLIIGAVFLLFGMMNPVFAKFTPEILQAAGINMVLPTPTALDSWAQFFKNIGQTGLLVLVIIFSGIMANEFSRGTLINILTKGLKRSTVILSKFTAATIIWTFSYLLCYVVSYFYTAYFWSMSGMSHIFLSFFSMWLYGVLLIALVIFGGVLFKNIYGSLFLTGGTVLVLTLVNISPKLQKYNPITLSSDNMSLLSAQKNVSDFLPALIICAAIIIVLIIISIAVFNKKQI